ncbi:MAG: response regulator [Candidatus Omnitrophica bacterium]|nr:response regulator [Candidatus Omnitrophota bacterium]
MRGRSSKYHSILVQVMAWAKECLALITLKKAWEKGQPPASELAEKVEKPEHLKKLEEEVFRPGQAAAQRTFDPKAVKIEVYGGSPAKKAKEAPAPSDPEPTLDSKPHPESPSMEKEVVVEMEVELPSLETSAAETLETRAPSPAEEPLGPRKPCILVIDDYEPLLQMLCTALKGAGYDVCAAKDGLEGLVRLHENRVNLIITDVQMPKLDGFDLSRMLNVRETTRDLPIVFLTEVLDEQTKAVARRLGAADTLVKPFTLDSLLDSVRAILAHQEFAPHSVEKPKSPKSEPLFSVVK